MSFRISDNVRLSAMTRAINQVKAQNMHAAREASTGIRIGAPSDDPLGAAQALRVQTSLDQTNSYRNTIRTVRGDVELSESTLADISDLLGRAHELALAGGSDQTTSLERSAYSKEADGLKERLLSLMNQKGSQGYLFGGSKTHTPPFDGAGAFQGDDLERRVQIGANVVSVVSVSGASAFTAAGGQDVFAAVNSLTQALHNDDPVAARATINGLNGTVDQVIAARSEAGLKLTRLDAADAAHTQAQVSLSTSVHALVDSDQVGAYTRLVTTQQTLEQAIGVSKNMLDTLSSAHLA